LGWLIVFIPPPRFRGYTPQSGENKKTPPLVGGMPLCNYRAKTPKNSGKIAKRIVYFFFLQMPIPKCRTVAYRLEVFTTKD